MIDLALASDLGEDSRLLAVNALAHEQRDDVLDALLQLSVGGRSLFGRMRLPAQDTGARRRHSRAGDDVVR